MATGYILSDNGVSSGSAGLKSGGGNDGTLQLQTTTSGGTATTAMTVDNNQNVGVGVTPSAWATVKPVVQFPNGNFIGSQGSVDTFYVGQNHYYDGTSFKYVINGYATQYQMGNGNGQHQWKIAASGTAGNNITFTQAMTLDASGNLLVGKTSSAIGGKLEVNATSADTVFFSSTWNGVTSYSALVTQNTLASGGSSGNQIKFLNASGSTVGAISSTGSATTYATSSDYRLKEEIQPMTGALERISALKPVTYKWKDGGFDGEGFIAHELADVCPNAVVGKKDAVETYTDEEGNEQTRPVYQGIDTSFLVATLTAAIQEQQALITSLTERITALEAK